MARGVRAVPSCNLKNERRMGRAIYMVRVSDTFITPTNAYTGNDILQAQRTSLHARSLLHF